ncbi:flagellar biosynthesis protein FlgG [Helicobacter sp. 12S02634-8]|uniref:flagellar hook-basal body protein n=1 Tax=Helicobacter sp. 12S02634-8 TaxID=1476199 RepID=UPI000BA715A1|nr:flagellar hook-basal body protein [Helicobacter sp. 12S02634-8]PAF47831.1 flagellar biosynthesis protein FlgG [Helicobacter sp. 12S02634-8]
MQNGYYSATGGMVTQFNRLDIISNNLANLNTNAFKRDDVVIGDFLRLYQTHQETLPINNQTRDGAKYINRNLNRVPIISEEYTNKALGAISKTDNPLDFALQKENTYFAIQTPNGVRYTRDGSFTIGTDGILSTKEGYHILSRVGLDNQGGILLPQGMQIEADVNGNLYFRDTANEAIAQPLAAGAIAIVSFDNPKYLKKVGNNLYEYPQDKLDDRQNLITPNALIQYSIERSNVNAITEMTQLIETNRLVDMYAKVLKTHMDDLNTEAISKLAVRA